MASEPHLRYTHGMKTIDGHGAFILATLIVFGTAPAGTQTYMTLAGRDDSIPKLGRPGIAVQVAAPSPADASLVANELTRDLVRLVHTRPLAAGEAGDYDLEVTIEPSRTDGAASTIPFAAALVSARGERIWRIDGRAETQGPTLEPPVFISIGRNVVSALIHDGWLQPKYDPNDPPPNPPRIRNDDSAR
jgi:hypothetical protein